MSIGENGVGKERAWDRRTPLGIYFANEQLDTSRMHDKYGPMAFPLDYPNAWDEVNARTGDGIWIHGVDRNGEVSPLQQRIDQCVALFKRVGAIQSDLEARVGKPIAEWKAGDLDELGPVYKRIKEAPPDERAELVRVEFNLEPGATG